MKSVRKYMIALVLLLSLTFIPLTGVQADENTLTIVLDPGHGGTDSGAYHHSIMEKNVNLKIAQYMKEELNTYHNIRVIKTRTSDVAVSLNQRVNIAKEQEADLFVSLHANSSDSSVVSGVEVFYPNGNFTSAYHTQVGYEKTKELASEFQKGIVSLGLRDCGIKTRNSTKEVYQDGSIADYYHVIRETKRLGIPAVLVEHGYISNLADVNNHFSSDEQLQALAKQNVETLEKTLNLSKDTKGSAKITIKVPTKTEYLVGEELDPTGLQVTATYSNGESVVLKPEEYQITGFDSSKLGNRLITVSYMDATAQFVVCVVEQMKECTLLGDVNGDGEIKASDYAIIKDSFMTGLTLSDQQLKRADVKQNQSLQASDYLMIKDYIMGILNTLPSIEVEQPVVEQPVVEKPVVEKPEEGNREVEKPVVEKPEEGNQEVKKPEENNQEVEKTEVDKTEVDKTEEGNQEVDKTEVDKSEVEKTEVHELEEDKGDKKIEETNKLEEKEIEG